MYDDFLFCSYCGDQIAKRLGRMQFNPGVNCRITDCPGKLLTFEEASASEPLRECLSDFEEQFPKIGNDI